MRSQRMAGVLGWVVLATGLAACRPSNSPTGPTGGGSGPTTPTAAPAPVVGASGPTGSYLLTMTASPSCDAVKETYTGQILPLPDAVRIRRYTAEFANGTATLTAADGTGNKVPLGGVDGYAYPGRALMTLKGNELTIVVPPEDGGGYIVNSPTCAGGDYWWEVLDSTPGRNQVFESCGTWTGTIQDSGRIEGTIYGTFAYYFGQGPNWTTDLFCRATNHRFTLEKR